MSVVSWESQRKCDGLDPVKADEIFFPGQEGKRGSRGAPSKAVNFCKGCEVRALCLLDAIENDLDGNWAGTSKKERRQMVGVVISNVTIRTAEERVTATLPIPIVPKGKRVSKYLIIKPTEDPYSWMDTAVGPPMETVV